MTPLDLPDDTTVVLEQRPLLLEDGEGLGVQQEWTREEMTYGLALDEIRAERVPTIWRVFQSPLGTRSWLYTSAEGEPQRLDFAGWVQPGQDLFDWLRAWEACQNSVWMVEGLAELDPVLTTLAVLQIARVVYNDEGVTRFLLTLRECLHTKTPPDNSGSPGSRDTALRSLVRQVLLLEGQGLRGSVRAIQERMARGSLILEASTLVRIHCVRDDVPIVAQRVQESIYWKERVAQHADVIRSIVSPDAIFVRLRKRCLDRLALLRERDAARKKSRSATRTKRP